MISGDLPGYIQMLLRPQSYSHPAADIQLIQTHISYVVLAGEYVYKFKKPVNFGFLDFSSLNQREYYCGQELELNRRLCADIYLALVSINKSGSDLYLNGPGPAVEYGVQMRRLPEQRMMTNLIKRGELEASHIQQLVQVLVPFYQRAQRSEAIDSFGHSSQVAVNVSENLEQIEPFIGQAGLSEQTYKSLACYFNEFLQRQALFASRVRSGRIRDCHGDLHSGNICLDTPVHIFDCIEFNERFRYGDVAGDIAFLAMDLDFYGLDQLADLLIHRFIQYSDDRAMLEMLNFYKCYRACVLAKIGLFTASDATIGPAKRSRCLEKSARYFKLAQRYVAAAEGC